MKILITGSTSPQASLKTALRVPTFASLMYHHLGSQGVVVELKEPSMYMTEEEVSSYDMVFVGIAPPTSLSANRTYPAFYVANLALKQDKLILFIDAPEPYKIQASLKSCYLNVSDLQKDFYKMRKFYDQFVGEGKAQNEVYEFIETLYTQEWPTLVYPAFPWSDSDYIRKALPNVGKVFPINLDSTLVQVGRIGSDLFSEQTYWTCDAPKTRWAQRVSRTLAYPVVPSRDRKWDVEDVTLANMKNSIGTLISLYRSDEVWWSPALAQSLSTGTPVVTDWRYSKILGPEWSYLGSSVEEMSNSERFDLAVAQRDFYLGYLNSAKNPEVNLEKILKHNKKEKTLV
jgi:hypothetical protein